MIEKRDALQLIRAKYHGREHINMGDPSLYMIHVKLEAGFDEARVKTVANDIAQRLAILVKGYWSKGWSSDDGGSITFFASTYLGAQDLMKQLEGENLNSRSF